MINLEILAYIDSQKKAGISDPAIMDALVTNGGWKKSDVQEAFNVMNLPRGSTQAAQMRAALLRGQAQKSGQHKTLRRVTFWTILSVILLCIVGSIIWSFMSSTEVRQSVVDKITALPEKVTSSLIKNTESFIESVSNSSSDNLLATSTPITECGNFNYETAEKEYAGISGSACLSEHFRTCTFARLSATVNGYKTTYVINGAREADNGNIICMVEETITGSSMSKPQKFICGFNRADDWSTAQEKSSSVCKSAK